MTSLNARVPSRLVVAALACGISAALILPGSIAYAVDEAPPTTESGEVPAQAPAAPMPDTDVPTTEASEPDDVPDTSAPEPTAAPEHADSASATNGASAPAPTDGSLVDRFQESLAGSLAVQGSGRSVTSGFGLTAASLASDNEAGYRDLLNDVRIGVCLPIINNHAGLTAKARSWATTTANRGYAATQSNLAALAPEADWVAQHVVGSYDALTGYDFLYEAVIDDEVASWLIDEELSDIGVGIAYFGAGYTSANVTNFASIPNHVGGQFLDVRPWSKFYREISWMRTAGLSTGTRIDGCTTERVYQPKSRVSREAMAAFLYRLSGDRFTAPKVSPFSDVKPGDKFYREIAWMHAKKLSTGTAVPGKKPAFAPKAQVSREAMAAFMYRYSKASYTGPKASPFSDVRRGDKFYNEIAWMHHTGLSTGTRVSGAKPVYAPKDRVSREAMAAFIYRSER